MNNQSREKMIDFTVDTLRSSRKGKYEPARNEIEEIFVMLLESEHKDSAKLSHVPRVAWLFKNSSTQHYYKVRVVPEIYTSLTLHDWIAEISQSKWRSLSENGKMALIFEVLSSLSYNPDSDLPEVTDNKVSINPSTLKHFGAWNGSVKDDLRRLKNAEFEQAMQQSEIFDTEE